MKVASSYVNHAKRQAAMAKEPEWTENSSPNRPTQDERTFQKSTRFTVCPKCQSDDWKLASFVYKAGLTHVTTRTDSFGVGVSSGGMGVGGSTGNTSGIHQTELSKLAAPPIGFEATTRLILFAFLFFFLGLFWHELFPLAALCLFGIVFTWSPDAKKQVIAMAEWNERRLCQRCGTLY